MSQHLCDVEICKNCIILYGPFYTFIYDMYDKGKGPKIVNGYLRRYYD